MNNNIDPLTGKYTHGRKRLEQEDDGWRMLLNGLSLRGNDASLFMLGLLTDNPTVDFGKAFSDFKSWIQDLNASNMAAQLSRQLAAAVLNLEYSRYNMCRGTEVFWNSEWVVMNDAVARAVELLQAADVVVDSMHPDHAEMESLKNMFDAFNNNLLQVQGAAQTEQPFVTPPCPLE